MAALGSGSSFGFFMGIGAVMRSEMEGSEECEDIEGKPRREVGMVEEIDGESGKVVYSQIYKRYML